MEPETYSYKSTTAFDDQFEYGFVAQEVDTAFPGIVQVDQEAAENSKFSVTMNVGATEMLRVAKDGFYVRGVKVEADAKEAETVYNAFKEFLVWAELNRS